MDVKGAVDMTNLDEVKETPTVAIETRTSKVVKHISAKRSILRTGLGAAVAVAGTVALAVVVKNAKTDNEIPSFEE